MASLLKTHTPFVSFTNKVMINSIAFLYFGMPQGPKIEGSLEIAKKSFWKDYLAERAWVNLQLYSWDKA